MKESRSQLIESIGRGDIRALSKAITLAESTLTEQRNLALEIIEHFGPQPNTFRIGITGTPGAGKSTFIEAAGLELLKDEKVKLAVLSVDPSSSMSGGSILGDKTRMSKLSAHPSAYIRPTASGNQMGGLAKNTRLAMLLCEAAGYTHILIESVGVGQGETETKQLTDFFVLLLNPGGGDELQGIKRGIMEVADLLVINKADGDYERQASLTAKEYSMALHLRPVAENGWNPKVITASALHEKGITAFWQRALEYESTMQSGGFKSENRLKQQKYWAKKSVHDLLLAKLGDYEKAIENGLKEGKLPERIAKQLI